MHEAMQVVRREVGEWRIEFDPNRRTLTLHGPAEPYDYTFSVGRDGPEGYDKDQFPAEVQDVVSSVMKDYALRRKRNAASRLRYSVLRSYGLRRTGSGWESAVVGDPLVERDDEIVRACRLRLLAVEGRSWKQRNPRSYRRTHIPRTAHESLDEAGGVIRELRDWQKKHPGVAIQGTRAGGWKVYIPAGKSALLVGTLRPAQTGGWSVALGLNGDYLGAGADVDAAIAVLLGGLQGSDAAMFQKALDATEKFTVPEVKWGESLDEAKYPNPPFREWRIASRSQNAVVIVHNRVGKRISSEEAEQLIAWARENKIADHATFRDGKVSLLRTDLEPIASLGEYGAAGLKAEKRDAVKKGREDAHADRVSKEQERVNGSKENAWLEKAFPEMQVNDYTRWAFVTFLAGENKYPPLLNATAIAGMKRLGALSDSGQVDWDKVKSAYHNGTVGESTDPAIHEAKAQDGIMVALKAKPKGEYQLSDLSRHPDLRGVHFKSIQSGASALKKKGKIDYDGISTVSLKEDDGDDDYDGEPLDEVSPPGFSGTVRAMIDKHGMDKSKAMRLAWAMYKRGAKPRKKPEKQTKGIRYYITPDEYERRRAAAESVLEDAGVPSGAALLLGLVYHYDWPEESDSPFATPVEELADRLPARLLTEMSLSRIYRHLQAGKGLACLTAYRSENDKATNRALNYQLEQDVKRLGLGYVKVIGGSIEVVDGEERRIDGEESLFIFNAGDKLPALERLAFQKYRQTSILIGYTDGRVVLKDADGKESELGNDLLTNKESIGIYYSKWRNRVFSVGRAAKRAAQQVTGQSRAPAVGEGIYLLYAPRMVQERREWHAALWRAVHEGDDPDPDELGSGDPDFDGAGSDLRSVNRVPDGVLADPSVSVLLAAAGESKSPMTGIETEDGRTYWWPKNVHAVEDVAAEVGVEPRFILSLVPYRKDYRIEVREPGRGKDDVDPEQSAFVQQMIRDGVAAPLGEAVLVLEPAVLGLVEVCDALEERGSVSKGTVVTPPDSLGIKRADMPQIKREKYPLFLDWLKQRGIDYRLVSVPAKSLKASQSEISLKNVATITAATVGGADVLAAYPITISRDNYVMDGHHRWFAAKALNPDVEQRAYRIDLPARELLKVMDQFGREAGISRKDISIESVDEGIFDRAVLKAVFVCGAGGSGKSYLSGKAFGGMGFRVINPDDAFEFLARQRGYDLSRPEVMASPEVQALRDRAKGMTAVRQRLYLDSRMGVLIDGTAAKPEKVLKLRKELEELGYDTAMFFVNVPLARALEQNAKRNRRVPVEVITDDWNRVQQAIPTYRSVFGDRFYEFKPEKTYSDEEMRREVSPALHRIAVKLAAGPVENPVGRAWLEGQLGPDPASRRLQPAVG